MPNDESQTTIAPECAVLLECLRLAHGERNRAAATEQDREPPQKVIERARIYADFVLGKVPP